MRSTKETLVKLAVAPAERTVLQVPRAVLASLPAGAVDFGALVAMVQFLHWQAVFAAIVSYILGGVVQYVLCAIWVFPAAPRNAVLGFTAFTLLSLVGLGITAASMTLFHSMIGLHYALAKVVSLALAFCWNFTSRKYLLFRRG